MMTPTNDFTPADKYLLVSGVSIVMHGLEVQTDCFETMVILSDLSWNFALDIKKAQILKNIPKSDIGDFGLKKTMKIRDLETSKIL